MDLLTHLFLPLTVAYVLRRELFDYPGAFALAVFGLFPDFDKFLGEPGLLHSLVIVVPVCLAILAVEGWYRGGWWYAPLVVAFIGSHLVLDILDGGPVPLLYPFVEQGVGLQYPAQLVFGADPVGLAVRGPLVTLRVTTPRSGYGEYGFLTGEGIALALTFVVLFVGLGLRDRRDESTVLAADGGVEK